ncbi:MAG: long-chain fatty acid--CoA ligase [Myxococcota bacterium]|jgi:long-chain acyl-CoA synthetase|nr:long-chain fatty acid--CoA ligase [Myxococcota bacterium]
MTTEETLVSVFNSQVSSFGNREALLERRGESWASTSWNEWSERSRAIAAALIEDGVGVGEHVALFSYSRRAWVEADIGILMAGARTVTIYHNVNADTVQYILEDAGPRVVFVEGPIQVRCLLSSDGQLPNAVKRVVFFEESQVPLPRPGEKASEPLTLDEVSPKGQGNRIVSLERYIEMGKAAAVQQLTAVDDRIAALRANDVAKIVYTSGTTGTPKGAMLTHRNLLSVVESVQGGLKLRTSDLMLMFLPLAHVYAQLAYHAMLKVGFTMAFARSMLLAIEDAESVRPHFFVTVPRLFEKIHAAALQQVEKAGGIKKAAFSWASRVGARVSSLRQDGKQPGFFLSAQHRLADTLVFSKLKDRLGGRVRLIISGGAPLPLYLNEFFDAAGLTIVEGYGMTENASLSHYNRIERRKFGSVGPAIPGIEQRVAEDGEILVRGDNVMRGYLNKPQETAESIDEDHWLHTGDIGFVDADGFLTITDRKKELIVTSGGKNVPPAPIEARLSQSRFVVQAVVFGDRRKYLVALLTLEADYVQLWAKDHGLGNLSVAELAKHPKLNEAVAAEIDAVNSKLDPFSTVKKFALLPREFSTADGELTPSLKLKRRVIEQRHRDSIEALYRPEPGK